MKKVISVLFIALGTISCNETLEYKYQDKGQVIDCPGVDSKLIHEALYSFENDIGTFYNNENFNPNSIVFIEYGYANFIFPGAMGDADYKSIASPHTIKLIEELKKEDQLWDRNLGESNLNYNSEFVKCLISKIQNEDIKIKLENLIEVNALSPKIMAEIYRVNSYNTLQDKYFAMFIALDTYYQYTLDIDLSKPTGNE